jgi:hypothetical protein
MTNRAKNLDPHVRDALEATLDNFNAEEVSKVFRLMEWSWADSPEPQPYEIRAFARDLMTEAFWSAARNNGEGQVESGRIRAEYVDGEFSVAFVPISS